jgi:hypothetical protein
MFGRMPTPIELAHFLWLLSPEYRDDAPIRRYLFGRRIRKINYLDAVKACWKYLEDTFQDSPSGSGMHSTPYAGWCAHLVCSLSDNPVEAEQLILNTPLKRLFQYLKVRRKKNDRESTMHNPSDKLKGDYIRMVNARNDLLKVLRKRMQN